MRFRMRRVTVLVCTAVVVAAGLTTAAIATAGTTPAAEVSLSRAKPVAVSSSGGCCAAGNAVDGRSGTRWASEADKDPQWIYVDLGATTQITRVRLQWDESCATAYQLQTSSDHETWTDIFKTTSGKGGVEDRKGLSGSGRYVRMLGTHRCRTGSGYGYSLQEFDVYGPQGGGDNPPSASPGQPAPSQSTPGQPAPGQPFADPNLVSMFNGTSLAGWTPSAAAGWDVKDNAIHGTGSAGRGWIYYKTQVGSFRWIFNVRQLSGNHAPTVLIWGTTTPTRDALSGIQFQPPNGGHWDYRPGKNTSGGNEFTTFPHPKMDAHEWSQCEIVGDQNTGVARMGCCPLPSGATTCKATEVLDFKDPTAGRVGPLAIQVHNGGIQDEYRNLFIESPVVVSPDKLITT